MRKLFASFLYQQMLINSNIILLTGDLGYGLWDGIKSKFPDRYINTGSSEQLMVGMAVGAALEHKIPVVYSITPFLLYRPFEIIRNYLHYERIPVKLLGGGRDKDYGKLGYTHWAEEDQKIINVLNNITSYRPEPNDNLERIFNEFLYNDRPSYMNLIK